MFPINKERTMNIFAVNEDPVISARESCDAHSIKMPLEVAQMLCTNLHLWGLEAPYKPTHKNHPCTKWARESLGNWKWLLAYGNGLGEEYTRRYGKTHKSHLVIKECAKALVPLLGERTPFALAMDVKWKLDNPYASYQYYIANKVFKNGSIPTWKHTSTPQWFHQYKENAQ